jgi:hypothetical protein
MTKRSFGKDAWVEMFRTAGLDDAMMTRWHHGFETHWPDDHERFLVWLGLPEAEITRLRRSARSSPRHP